VDLIGEERDQATTQLGGVIRILYSECMPYNLAAIGAHPFLIKDSTCQLIRRKKDGSNFGENKRQSRR
jgi:hypothetical protein